MLSEKTIAYLDGVNGKNMKQGLEHLSLLMQRLNWPDRNLKIIHITGTNGKGSTSEFLRTMLQEAGYRVGTFNSPYFESPCECIRINGMCITENEMQGCMEQMEDHLQALGKDQHLPSGFEILTALALWYFSKEQVDFVILEVGLGGRLDATNIIGQSIVSVFTEIAMDHINVLGDTLEAIATEKAGIIKKNSLVVSAQQQLAARKALVERSRQMGCRFESLCSSEVDHIKVTSQGTVFRYRGCNWQLQMIGRHQAYNCALAVKVLMALKAEDILTISEEQLLSGAFKMKWPGRFEKVQDMPEIYLDGAHNLNGIVALRETLSSLEPAYTIGVVGVLRDKEADKMMTALKEQFDEVIVTAPCHVRAMGEDELEHIAKRYFMPVFKEKNIHRAVELAEERAGLHQGRTRIICFGSLYMIADIRKVIN